MKSGSQVSYILFISSESLANIVLLAPYQTSRVSLLERYPPRVFSQMDNSRYQQAGNATNVESFLCALLRRS